MLRKVTLLLAVVAVSIPAFSASETFAGTWKFNDEQSDPTGQIVKIAALNNNEFVFSIGDALVCAAEANENMFGFTVKADGIEHHTVPGAKWSIAIKDQNTWELGYKSERMGTAGTATWTVSPDGKTLLIKYKGTTHDGTRVEDTGTLKRISGSGGFTGTWQQTGSPKSSVLQIDVPTDSSLAVTWPSDKSKMIVNLDGKDSRVEGPRVLKDLTASAQQIDDHLIQVTHRLDGRLLDTTDWKLSSDGRVLTVTERNSNRSKAAVSVYDRQ
jgi:hypothetical protein